MLSAQWLVNAEVSSTMRALSSAHCTDVTQALHIKDRYQNNERPQALTLLNSPLVFTKNKEKATVVGGLL